MTRARIGRRARLRRSGVSIDPAPADIPKVIQAARFLLLALLAWWTVGFAVHPLNGAYSDGSFLHLINLPFHEAGHILFLPFGTFMTAFGGSLMQVLIPVVCAASFVKREDWFAAAVCGWWAPSAAPWGSVTTPSRWRVTTALLIDRRSGAYAK